MLTRKINKLAEEALAPMGLAQGHAYLLHLVLEQPALHPLYLSKSCNWHH
jgi:hypothetical protein